MNMPRAEHPMPQWERTTWENLNGTWEFEFDFGCSGMDRKIWEKDKLDMEILVPFCPESRLSGIGYTDFINAAAYRKTFTLTEKEMAGKTFLHFGAVDYEASVYINNKLVGTHKGGYTSFSYDITTYVTEGENTIFLYVKDDVRSGLQPKGKQSHFYHSIGCDYTRTTGIWQTVWLEFVPNSYIKSAKYYPDPANTSLTIIGNVVGSSELTITASWEGKTMASRTLTCSGGSFSAELLLEELHLWEAGKGGLYDLTFTFGEDTVKSYFGMRSTRFEGKKYMLNDKSLFQRTVLDQGFYPEGIYTAPTDEDLIKDIELSYAAGFNGARLHQKVFEPRFLYHCDRLGYLVWGEYPNWGLKYAHPQATEIYLNEWRESIERDFNHPAIIGWCPFNESWGYSETKEENALISSMYHLTKSMDPTRPCIDTSGVDPLISRVMKINHPTVAEVYDIHDYTQNPDIYKERFEAFSKAIHENEISEAKEFVFDRGTDKNDRIFAPFFFHPYLGQPIFVSEYGGIRWVENAGEGWGYGESPKTAEEFFDRYKRLTDVLLDNEDIFGFCYTQLYDIEQEINGIYTYDRQEKFDVSLIKEINQRPAAIERI